MRLIDADVLKQHIDKLPALPDGNFAGNHSALKALINMQPTIEPSTSCSEIPNGSDDTISRQAAIDALARMMPRSYTPDGSHPADEEIFRAQEVFADCIEVLEILPSAQPEQNEKWIYNSPTTMKCNRCGFVIKDWDWHRFKYCPNCRADMRGKQDETD